MNKKQLIEKKAHLISLMEQMVNKATVETRELDETETSVFEQLKEEVKKIANQLQELVAEEAQTEETQHEKGTEERMINELLNGQKVELRAMDTTNTSSAVANTLFDDIQRKMKETSGIFKDLKVVTNHGDIEFLVQNEEVAASFLGETASCTPTDLSAFSKVKLSDKRLATSVLISKKLLANGPVSEAYIQEVVAERMAYGIERALLAPTTEENSVTNTLVASAEAKKFTEALTIDALIKLITGVKQSYVNGGKLIVSRAMFQKMAALKDGTGRAYMVNSFDHATNSISYSILGVPVIISEFMKNDAILFVNLAHVGVFKMAESGLTMTALTEKYAENGQLAIIAEMFGDFGITNTDELALFEIGA